MAAQHEGGDVLHRDVEFLGEEVAEARAVQNAGHAADHVVRQARELAQRPDHRVERVGDADDEGVRRVVADALAHGFHDLEVDAQKVVAAHARLARHTGGDDADIRARDVGVIVRALELGVEPSTGRIRRCRAPCPAACPRRCRRGSRRPVPSARRDGRACRRSAPRRSVRSWVWPWVLSMTASRSPQSDCAAADCGTHRVAARMGRAARRVFIVMSAPFLLLRHRGGHRHVRTAGGTRAAQSRVRLGVHGSAREHADPTTLHEIG
jgi:hypothetical protein